MKFQIMNYLFLLFAVSLQAAFAQDKNSSEFQPANITSGELKNGMLEYLEKNGIKFGSEINAFTSFDETVYNINGVPVENEKLLDSVLLVLHDWSGGLTLADDEIDN